MASSSFTKKSIGTEQTEPGVTPPPSTSNTTFAKKPKLTSSKSKKREIPEGLWTKCPRCSTMVFDKELEENLKICTACQYHFPISARQRIHSLTEEGTFEEMDSDMISVDVLKFTGASSYISKLNKYQQTTGLNDAVITGLAKMGERRVGLGVMDFSFLGGSMGSVVGEKLTRLVESATQQRLPIILFSTSGGARMYEGMFSLMQMAKTCGALAYHAQSRLPYISVLTDPTMAGVMASFATVGDLIIAEPGAMIGFAGPRVIKDTTQAELPSGFQTAEFLLDHGLIDSIVSRKEMKVRLIEYLSYLSPKANGAVPDEVRQPSS